MSAYSSLDLYYELDERRRRSPELDFGVVWRFEGGNYRLTWVVETGELIAVHLWPVRRIDRTIRIATHADGLEAFAGEPMEVYVLLVVSSREVVEQLLEGWADACWGDDSLLWVVDRVRAQRESPATYPHIAVQRSGRRRRLPLLPARPEDL